MKSILAAALLLATPALAQTPVRVSGTYIPLGYCQITSLGSAVALVSASCSTGAVPAGATILEICVETAEVRYRDDSTAPTTSLGMPVAPLSSTVPFCFQYAATPLSQLQFIAVSGSPVVDVAFYK
jgi:hypothetical protein